MAVGDETQQLHSLVQRPAAGKRTVRMLTLSQAVATTKARSCSTHQLLSAIMISEQHIALE